jgi:acyl-CoA synthetase (NDP forming)
MNKEIKQLLQVNGALAENEVKDILNSYGIQTTRYQVVETQEDIKQITLTFPVALKVCSRSILHKTDVDGVKLNIQNKDDLLRIFTALKKKFPNERFIVDEMVEKGVEAIIGLVKDPTFGLTIMTGVGGIYTELYQDVSFRVVPIVAYDAKEMIEELMGKKLLDGFRNIKTDTEQFIQLILKVSKIGEELLDRIDQMDLNPVFIYEKGYCVVDAKMILKE